MPSLKTDFVDKTASPRIRYRLIAILSLAAFLLFKSAPFFLSDQPHPPSPDVHHTEDSTGHPYLTQVEVAAPSDNHIFLVEIYYPPKQAVLDYLSSPSTVNPPPRFARVTLHHGAAQHPFVRNYLVGPLPIAPHTSMSPLTNIYQVDPFPYNARAWYINDWSSPEIYSNIAAPVAEAFKELFGGQAAGLPNDTLVAGGAGPFSYDGSFRRLWLSWRRSISGPFLRPLNFYQYIDISGTDTSQWKLLKTVYNHQIFDTIESFLEALHNGSLKAFSIACPGRYGLFLEHQKTRWRTARLGPYFTDKPIFHLDGTIEVRVSASGYLQAGYWDPDQRNLGNYHGKSTRPCYQLQGRPRCCGHCQLPLENDDESRSCDSSLV
ncbi:hypothetical protein EV363DRAFT_1373034 [Boletus edulis]|nr:hypothetical protein EV363DRAFT_1373034 [Boletus edulis]